MQQAAQPKGTEADGAPKRVFVSGCGTNLIALDGVVVFNETQALRFLSILRGHT
jgi:hypothetical protein